MQSILNIRSHLSRLLGRQFSGKRDLYEVLGYSKMLRPEDFYMMYKRNDIAKRIIKAYPQATWRDMPKVRDEAGQTSEESKFVEAFEDLYEKKKLAHFFERADRLSSIGHFGLLLMGFNDGKRPDEPLEPGDHELLYMCPYAEHNVVVTRWDMRTNSPRYGLPYLYSVQVGHPQASYSRTSKSITVHYSRVMHISEMLDEDDIFGTPRLEAIYNRLQDLEKVVGGSAESFWLMANKGLALLADADAKMTDQDRKDAKEQAEEYQHQMRRILTLQGMTVQSLGSDTPKPKETVDILIDLIAGTEAIPKRILLGNEAGELASSQDENNWNSRVDERRSTFAGPMILRPFIDLMIATGNLIKPQGEYWIEWDEKASLSEKEIAEVVRTRMEALKSYTEAPDGEILIPPAEFREMLGMNPEPEGGFELPDEEPEEEEENVLED